MANPCILYDNLLDDSTSLAASTTDPSSTDFNVANVIDLRPYTFWQADTATGVKYITVNTSQATAMADSFAVGPSHNLFTAGVTLSIQHSSDNFVAITTAATYTPTENKSFGFSFTSVANQDWRIAITQPTTVKPKISVAILGQRFPFPRAQKKTINPDAHTVLSEGADSKTIMPLGVTIRGKRRTQSVSINGLDSTWIVSEFLPRWDAHIGESKPFIWKWNTAITSACYYMQAEPGSAFVSNYEDATEFRNLSFNMKGLYEE